MKNRASLSLVKSQVHQKDGGIDSCDRQDQVESLLPLAAVGAALLELGHEKGWKLEGRGPGAEWISFRGDHPIHIELHEIQKGGCRIRFGVRESAQTLSLISKDIRALVSREELSRVRAA